MLGILLVRYYINLLSPRINLIFFCHPLRILIRLKFAFRRQNFEYLGEFGKRQKIRLQNKKIGYISEDLNESTENNKRFLNDLNGTKKTLTQITEETSKEINCLQQEKILLIENIEKLSSGYNEIENSLINTKNQFDESLLKLQTYELENTSLKQQLSTAKSLSLIYKLNAQFQRNFAYQFNKFINNIRMQLSPLCLPKNFSEITQEEEEIISPPVKNNSNSDNKNKNKTSNKKAISKPKTNFTKVNTNTEAADMKKISLLNILKNVSKRFYIISKSNRVLSVKVNNPIKPGSSKVIDIKSKLIDTYHKDKEIVDSTISLAKKTLDELNFRTLDLLKEKNQNDKLLEARTMEVARLEQENESKRAASVLKKAEREKKHLEKVEKKMIKRAKKMEKNKFSGKNLWRTLKQKVNF